MVKKLYVILPVYNDEKFLNRCLGSILAQSYDNMHIICIDDGSTDSSPQILDDYSRNYKFISVFHKENGGGPASARNFGLNQIKDYRDCYITLVDHDDRLEKDYFKKLIERMENDGSDAICSSYISESERGIFEVGICYENDCVISGYEATKQIILAKISPNPWAKIYKGEVYEKLRFVDGLYVGEDVCNTYKSFLNCKKVSIIHEPGYINNRFWSAPSPSRSKWSNKHTISCFICDRDRLENKITVFNDEQNRELMGMLLNDCADNFLQVYPRFNKKIATKDQIAIYKEYVRYINKNKIIKKFCPYNTNTKIKKFSYLRIRLLYKPLYKCFIKR